MVTNGRSGKEVVIAVRDVVVGFGEANVLNHLDLDVYRGEVLGFVGGSGAGKSVLMRTIIGLLPKRHGKIEVFGVDMDAASDKERQAVERRWGVLFQQGALFSAYNIFDNIAFPMRELRKDGWSIDESMLRQSVALKLHMVGLEPGAAWKHPAELSGGMLKRAALARALMLEAELLFLDEPTTGLDPASAADFDAMLGELHKELNLTVMMVTHDLYSVAALSDRIAVLDAGKLVTVGTLQEVAGFEHPFVEDFFRSRRNEIPLRDLARPRNG